MTLRGYKQIIVVSFILFELVYVLSIMASGNVPAFIIDNGEMILMAAVVFNMLILASLIF